MFLIVTDNIFEGLLITRKDNFRLKHLSSDTYFNLNNHETDKNIKELGLNVENTEMTFELKTDKVKYN